MKFDAALLRMSRLDEAKLNLVPTGISHHTRRRYLFLRRIARGGHGL